MTNITIVIITAIAIIYINITTNKILFFNVIKMNCFNYFIFSDFLCKYVFFFVNLQSLNLISIYLKVIKQSVK